MGRDQGWHFIQLGRHIERSIQTADSINIDFRELYRAGAESSSTDQATYLNGWGSCGAPRHTMPTGGSIRLRCSRAISWSCSC